MPFAEIPPSVQWASLSFRGEAFAEVWFKPVSMPHSLTFRIPQATFHHPAISQHLTIDNLLKAVGLSSDEVQSWRAEDAAHNEIANYSVELRQPLSELPPETEHLFLQVLIRQPEPVVELPSKLDPRQSLVKWQELQARWNTILGMEVTIDTLRQRMESLRAEIESESARAMTTDEKLNSLNADVAQWNKAKSRARYVLPRMKEFIHRATWVLGTPERKNLDEVFKKDAACPGNLVDLDRELQILLKDRQILAAQGTTCHHEGRASCDEIRKAHQTMHRNAASNAVKKRAATRAKGKTY